MKSCPNCHRKFDDESLNFCLDDGSLLLLTDEESEDPLDFPTVDAPFPRMQHRINGGRNFTVTVGKAPNDLVVQASLPPPPVIVGHVFPKTMVFNMAVFFIGLVSLIGSLIYILFLPTGSFFGFGVLGPFIGMGVLAVALRGFYDKRQIPKDEIPQAPSFRLAAYQWTKSPTNLRYVENLKTSHETLQSEYLENYKWAVTSWRIMDRTDSFIEFKKAQQLFQSWIKETETARSDMDSLEQHITEIVCGKVERSLHIFKEEWGKISDERRCYIDQLADVNSLLKNENNDERREKLQGAAADLKYEVANAVTKLKALEIPIKDLQSIVDKKSDLEGAASAVIKGFSLIQDINAERLKRAEMLLELKDEISIDQAALLVSATLEAGLKAISHNKNVESNLDRTEGIVEIAINLKNANVISKEDFKAVRACVDKVRNPVMHGNFGKVKSAEVQKQIHFVRRFFDQHGI